MCIYRHMHIHTTQIYTFECMFTNYARKHSLETDTNSCFSGKRTGMEKAAEDLVCTLHTPLPFKSCHMHYYMSWITCSKSR